MNTDSPMILIGIGTSGAAIARGVRRAFGEQLRFMLIDTDVKSSNDGDDNFFLIGGDRLSGRGTGGDIVAGRLAANGSLAQINPKLENVHLAIIVTALGGGTGGGATLECANHLTELGIPSIVFATTPFTFEGEDRQRNARGVMSMIEDAANATFFLPLDKLINNINNMEEAMHRAIDTVSTGVTFFWRMVEKPGYIAIDTERLRRIISSAGRGRFFALTAQGPNRATDIIDGMMRSEMLTTSSGPVQSSLCGILAGDDLLLSEVGKIADGVRKNFGGLNFNLATVNDEATFSGRISVVVMLFESSNKSNEDTSVNNVMSPRHHRKKGGVLSVGPVGRGRFKNAEPTIWDGEDLDIPTFIRKNLNLDF